MAFVIDNLFKQTSGFPGDTSIYSYNAGADTLAAVAAAGYFNEASDRLITGDRILITTSTTDLSFSGTFRVDGTTVVLDFDRTLFFNTQMADISAPSTAYIACPPAGVITQVTGVLWSAITVASSVLTFSIGTTAITGGAFTVTTGGVAGQVYTATPTALNLTSGSNVVKVVSDGGGTTTAIMTVGFKIICPAQV